jgi:hypothetical protein
MASKNDDSELDTSRAEGSRLPSGSFFLALGGIGFIYGAIAVFALVSYNLLGDARASSGPVTLSAYLPQLILVGIGVFGAVLGVALLRSVGLASTEPNRVINKHEWASLEDKVQAGEEKAVDQYIRLTSLTGITGVFTKLGLTGLPLATIGLTLIFSALAASNNEFMDLAKLTLGAFIGSFVQKQSQGSRGSVTLPTGETVSVRPASPSPPV